MRTCLTAFCLIILFLTSNQLLAQHPIEIDSRGRVASIELTHQEYQDYKDTGYNTSSERQALVSEIYETFADDFDFVALVLNETETPPTITSFGTNYGVKNEVQNIGRGVFDNTAAYGSDGKLLSLLQFPRRNLIRNGPSLHEIMHNWGAFGFGQESVSAPGTNLTSFSFNGHWGFTSASNKGQLGGFSRSTLVENGGNSYTVESFGPNANGGNAVPYTQLELYLMGMIPITEVDDYDVFKDITALSIDNANSTFTFTANVRNTYDQAGTETLLGGPRIPSSATAQKDFKMLIVVVTGAPLTQAVWDEVNGYSAFLELDGSDGSSLFNFWEATGGRGTLETGNLINSLPVAFTEFTAEARGKDRVDLRWVTSAENDNDFFALQRSANGVSWTHFGQVNGAGNAENDNYYYYTDEDPLAGVSYYRLLQTDFDGTTTPSPVERVVLDDATSLVAFPQPADNELIVVRNEVSHISLFTVAGQKVMDVATDMNSRRHRLNVDNLQAGSYLMTLLLKDGTQESQMVLIGR